MCLWECGICKEPIKTFEIGNKKYDLNIVALQETYLLSNNIQKIDDFILYISRTHERRFEVSFLMKGDTMCGITVKYGRGHIRRCNI